MKINYELTKDDYIQFNMNHISKSKTIKRTLFIERYIISIMFLIVPFMLKGRSEATTIFYYAPFILIFALWVIFFPKYFKYSVKRRLLKMLDSGKGSSMFGQQNLSITDYGIFEFDNMEKSKVTLKDVEKVEVTADHIYIYINSADAYIIPMRAFKTLSEKNELIDLLKMHCKVSVE